MSRRLPILFLLILSAACAVAEPVRMLANPARSNSSVPHLSPAPDGTVVMSWLERRGRGHALRFSTLDGERWSRPRTIAKGRKWFVNWADFPSVVPLSDELWAAHWLAKTPGGTYAYDVAMSISRDGGASWSEPLTPHTDGTPTEHGFVSLFAWNSGIGAVWLDGRNMAADGQDTHGPHTGGEGGGPMSLRFAMLTPDGAIAQDAVIDDMVCDCCQTDVASTAEGPLVAFRDRTPEEIRDIATARAANDAWQPPRTVAADGWRIPGCPVNGPAVAARDRVAAVVWFTAAQERPRVRVTFSSDAGRTFGPPIDIDTDHPMGRVDIEFLDGVNAAVVSWLRNTGEGNAAVCVRRVAADGTLGPVQLVTETAASRPAGFPQMIRQGDRLVFAWTEVADGKRRVRTATLPVADVAISTFRRDGTSNEKAIR